jgi:hypothetical protein
VICRLTLRELSERLLVCDGFGGVDLRRRLFQLEAALCAKSFVAG